MNEDERQLIMSEYDRLSRDLMTYYESIVSTERLALAGASAIVAFLYTELPSFASGQARIIALLPATIVALAALRCLSIYLVIVEITRYLRVIEGRLTSDPNLGFQRVFETEATFRRWLIEVTTCLLWLIALFAGVVFWLLYLPDSP